MLLVKTTALLLSALTITAHPGEDHHAEAEERRAALDMMGKRSLSHCNSHLSARGVHDRNAIRRRALYEQLRREIKARDITSAINTSHLSNITGVTTNNTSSTFFTGENQCILAPDVTEGPYYVTGELVRKDLRESQQGVPIYIDIQVVDTNTCATLPNVAVDFWHCNATGVYSGVVAQGNGDFADKSNINATHGRAVQTTDADGVAQFISIVPGHYTGRTNHIHILAHTEGTYEVLPNNTITGGTRSAHVGQLYFDQDLISQVTSVAPYSTNTQVQTTNVQDSIMAIEGDWDPIVEYVLLGDSITDGVFAWISIGLNANASRPVQAAGKWSGEGGGSSSSSSSNSGSGPGSGGPTGGGAGTSGSAAPSATVAGSQSSGERDLVILTPALIVVTVLLLAITPFVGLV